MLTINDPSSYGINTAGSNIQFTASNGTLLYAWEQSINSSALQVWIKNYYGNSVIDMQVLPEFENLFSANGYLGEAPQLSSAYAEYDNGKIVFGNQNDPLYSGSLYWNFSNSANSYYGGSTTNVTVNDGYHIDGTLPGNIYGPTFSGTQFNATFYGLTNASSNGLIGVQTNGVGYAYFEANTVAGVPFSISMYEDDANGHYEVNNNSYLNAGSGSNVLTIYYVFAVKVKVYCPAWSGRRSC